jgi:hypothetical protein
VSKQPCTAAERAMYASEIALSDAERPLSRAERIDVRHR